MIDLAAASTPDAPKIREEQELESLPVRVVARIVARPTVVMNCPSCGAEVTTDSVKAISLINDKSDLPPYRCSCGRMLIGHRPLVRLARG